jgi:hypothetical protein
MEATFFVAGREAAMRVRSWTDVPADSAADPLTVESPAALLALVDALGASSGRGVAPLTDATCQSFPVWVFEPRAVDAIAALSEDRLDEVASSWLERAESEGAEMDTDAHELSMLLGELQQALAESGSSQELFVLLEQKAF